MHQARFQVLRIILPAGLAHHRRPRLNLNVSRHAIRYPDHLRNRVLPRVRPEREGLGIRAHVHSGERQDPRRL
jgi:hypothetical protein